ncbi:WecB/TagA/CpsF family glycosyltransferase [Heliorestis acidaminivorans]|uniref:WecB/TagA/CpsF family glycosyltransferase n=1 Tax=Heliorestis acidaminivorans TaxID=553427 RepID=UPI001FAB065A|nr:WecB/TagA/CpsF family glycosyltransferase [Heliorestis acidaminivorans]
MHVINKVPSIYILGSPVHTLTLQESVQHISKLLERGGLHQIITANPEILYSARKDEDLQKLIAGASLVTADGIGVVWAARQQGEKLRERVTGIDLMAELLTVAGSKNWSCYFLGAAPGVAEKAGQKIKELHPGLSIAGTRHGYFKKEEEQIIIEEILEKKPQLLFVGLGAPRQEKWINNLFKTVTEKQARNLQQAGHIAMGVGGSFDVFAGTVKRAPQWTQKMHIEWLYRLLSQPTRIKRQVRLPLFALEVLRQKRSN